MPTVQKSTENDIPYIPHLHLADINILQYILPIAFFFKKQML